MPQIKDNKLVDIVMDELNREIAETDSAGFKAPQPNFPPTFKRKRNIGLLKRVTNGSLRSVQASRVKEILEFYDRKRTSYTDRILYRSMPNFESNGTPQSFVSFEDVMTSDHKPVGPSSLTLTV